MLNEITASEAFLDMTRREKSTAESNCFRYASQLRSDSDSDSDSDFDSDSDLDSDSDSDSDPGNADRNASEANLGQRQYSWPRRHRSYAGPNRELYAEEAEQALGYGGFAQTLWEFFEQNVRKSDIDRDPRIYVYNSMKITFPSWLQQEVVTCSETRSSKTNQTHLNDVDSNHQGRAMEYLLPSKSSRQTQRIISVPQRHRHQETILISTPNLQNRHSVDALSHRKVAQVLLFFQCPQFNESHPEGFTYELAYISWFDIKIFNNTNGLYMVSHSKRFGIVEVKDIERPIHLISKFGGNFRATVKAKRKMDKAGDRFQLLEAEGSSGIQQAGMNSPKCAVDPLWYYNEFYVNCWLDPYTYKNIF